jgi:hypothetical protein
MLKHLLSVITTIFFTNLSFAQLQWQNVDSLFQPLPSSVHVYKTTSLLDGKPNIAYYVEADIKNKKLDFTTDTSHDRRLTPAQFFERNDKPLVVVNTTFFSYETNRSLNVVVKDGKMVAYNQHSIAGKGKDTLTYRHPFGSALGISKKRVADVAWLYTDSTDKFPHDFQQPVPARKDSNSIFNIPHVVDTIINNREVKITNNFPDWKMKTAVGGGPVLIQKGEIKVTNNEELKFTGKAIEDKHPRTAMGYTKNNKLIILVIEGRHPGSAEGATLTQEAQIFKDLGCLEALNLDGGGSSCMLVNGKETIKISDAAGQRPVPAVFIIRRK